MKRLLSCIGAAAAAVLLLLAALPTVFVRLWFGAVPFLRTFGTRSCIDLPGMRHLRLSPAEYGALNDLKRAYGSLPPHIRARGVFNYSEDAALSVAFPETKFRHPMFVNWKNDVYPDYPARAMAYILEHRPPLVSSDELDLPGYVCLRVCELYGRRYYFYSPSD